MKKSISTLLLLVLVAIGANAQLLYKVTGKNLKDPSYIVGTYHLAPASFADSIPGMAKALNEVGQVYGELDMADMTIPANIQKMQAAMMLPEGQSLTTLLTAEQQTRLNGLLNSMMGADLTNPMMASQLGKLTPSALATQLTMLLYMQKHADTFDPNNLIDGYFQREAKAKNKIVGGLENIDFQIKVLYQSAEMPRQIEQLMCFVDHQDFQIRISDQIMKAYFSQNIDQIKDAMDEKTNDSCDTTPEEQDRLIYGRNADWVKKMPTIMETAGTLFVVGAAHLPGEKGVLHLLKAAGYTVEGVK